MMRNTLKKLLNIIRLQQPAERHKEAVEESDVDPYFEPTEQPAEQPAANYDEELLTYPARLLQLL